MRNLTFLLLFMLGSLVLNAQNVNEPEFIGQVVALNSDNTVVTLEKESASMKAKSSNFGLIPVPGSSLLDKTKMLLTVKGKTSKTVLPKGTLKFILRADNNNRDPKDMLGIFQFDVAKKERRYKMSEVGIINGYQSKTDTNTVDYDAVKYGTSSYLITIKDVAPGQYAIITGGDYRSLVTFGVE